MSDVHWKLDGADIVGAPRVYLNHTESLPGVWLLFAGPQDAAAGELAVSARTARGTNISAARRQAAEQGRQPCAGTSPYGYELVRIADVLTGRHPLSSLGHYLVREIEARNVRYIFDEYLSTGSSDEIARRLALKGVPSPTGAPSWNDCTVVNILRNPAYSGEAVYGRMATVCVGEPGTDGRRALDWRRLPEDQRIKIPCPPIVSEETFQAVQVALDGSLSRRRRILGKKSRPLLDGMVECGDCGRPMRSGTYPRTKTRQGGEYYACSACRPTWNATNSPRPRWSAYAARTIVPAASECLRALLPEEEGLLVLEFLFSTAWPIPIGRRRRLLLLASLVFRVFNNPFRVEVAFRGDDRYPKGAKALLHALIRNTRMAADEEAWAWLMSRKNT